MQATVRKADLMNILVRNRAEHRAQFEKALAGYKKKKLTQLRSQLRLLRLGDVSERWEAMPVPHDHTEDYDRAVRLVELHDLDTIELSEGDVHRYVMDNWEWKNQFSTTNSYYVQ